MVDLAVDSRKRCESKQKVRERILCDGDGVSMCEQKNTTKQK